MILSQPTPTAPHRSCVLFPSTKECIYSAPLSLSYWVSTTQSELVSLNGLIITDSKSSLKTLNALRPKCSSTGRSVKHLDQAFASNRTSDSSGLPPTQASIELLLMMSPSKRRVTDQPLVLPWVSSVLPSRLYCFTSQVKTFLTR